MNIKEKLPLLERMLTYLPKHGAYASNAVYVSPAQSLRNEANKIEQQEADEYEYRKLLEEIKNL